MNSAHSQIVNSLVEAYKQKNISLDDMLNDPVFQSLPIEKQLEAIQSNAGLIRAGVSEPLKRKILQKAMAFGAWGGFTSGVSTAHLTKNPKWIALTAGGVATLGAIAGATKGLRDYKHETNQKRTTNSYLERLETSPNLPDAVKLLQHKRTSSGRNSWLYNDYVGKGLPMAAVQILERAKDIYPQ